MAHVGTTTFPGPDTYPGFPLGALGEGPVPEPIAAPAGLSPRRALLLLVIPPTGKGAPITQECPPDLQFGSTAPGGFEQLSATLDWPADTPPVGLQTAATVQVVDRRTGDIHWHGHLVDPGFVKSGTGASRKIVAQGFQTVLDTQAGAVAYVDRDLGSWKLARDYKAGSAQLVDDVSLQQQPNDWVEPTQQVIEMDIPEGSKLQANTTMTMTYRPPKYSQNHQDIVSILGSYNGTNDAGYRVKVRVVTQAGTVQTIMDREYLPDTRHFRLQQGVGDWTQTGSRVGQIQWSHDGNDGVTSPRDYTLRWGNMAVVLSRVDRSGAHVVDPSTYVTTGDIVHDVAGRLLLGDLWISTSVLARPDTLVESAAWWDGITARGIMEFIEELEPDYYWAVWEPNISRPQPRFEYRSWRTFPRYLIPPGAATVQLAGGADDLCTHALVVYESMVGVPASLQVSGTAPELEAAGVVRTTVVDLTAEGPISPATAQRKGRDELARLNLQRASGTAMVKGRIMDMREGRMIEPWEMRAGWMVVIADGVLRADDHPYSYTGARDGRSTFRLTGVTYFASSGAAELQLDGGGRTLFHRTRIPLPRLRRKKSRSAHRYHTA
ncbi:hypothetical protein [Kineosporia sp. NBRC 101731]|uniref:hypothetical protein n=1 Tax=Kineosporia sp. NBRC 101731 TaxID=3032199 RepID=UPI0024A0291B|nr:hypothetical protein [Kineosporia sp. NBRC 101731]GLY32139.1 hypothetical protein Kisp02_55040 [Kineosporia sp. NBRC 101731]